MNSECQQCDRERRLINEYGEILSLTEMMELFRYGSVEAICKANSHGHFPVKLVKLPHRRGLHTTVKAVATVLSDMDRINLEQEGT
jgi:hypothetical protein